MAARLALLALLAFAAPAAAAPFPVGTWFGQGQPHDKSEMWIARMLAGGEFRVQFRTCHKGKATDQFEIGRWVLKDGLETIDIALVNDRPLPRRDQYRILHIIAPGDGGDIGVGIRILQDVQVHGGRDRLALDEAVEAGLAADRERGESAAALAHRPFQ